MLGWVFIAFFRCGEQGSSLVEVHGLLTAEASLVVERWRGGVSSCGSQALGAGSVVVALGLRCSEAHGVFLDQGSKPYRLRCRADSLPVSHQGSPGLHWLQ